MGKPSGIINETLWSTQSVRAMLTACEEWLGLRWNRSVTITYSRGDWVTGHAYLGSGPVQLNLPHPYPAKKRWKRIDPDSLEEWQKGGKPRWLKFVQAEGDRVDSQGVAPAALVAEVAWVITHELMHVQGWGHDRMRREAHPAYKPTRNTAPPPWVAGLDLRLKPAAVKRPPPTPEERRIKLAAAYLAKLNKVEADLDRWLRKAKLAQTKAKKLRAKLSRMRRHAAATPTNQEEPTTRPPSFRVVD